MHLVRLQIFLYFFHQLPKAKLWRVFIQFLTKHHLWLEVTWLPLRSVPQKLSITNYRELHHLGRAAVIRVVLMVTAWSSWAPTVPFGPGAEQCFNKWPCMEKDLNSWVLKQLPSHRLSVQWDYLAPEVMNSMDELVGRDQQQAWKQSNIWTCR